MKTLFTIIYLFEGKKFHFCDEELSGPKNEDWYESTGNLSNDVATVLKSKLLYPEKATVTLEVIREIEQQCVDYSVTVNLGV